MKLISSMSSIVRNYQRNWSGLKHILLVINVKSFATHTGQEDTGSIKIAEAFSSLPMKLAYRAYEEYLINLEQEHRFNNFVHAAFELWKRVIKQQMKLEDALEQTLSETTFYYPRLIECQIKNQSGWMHIIYWNCMAQIPVVEDDKALELITDLVNKKVNRRKVFVDYVKKKLEGCTSHWLGWGMCPLTCIAFCSADITCWV